MRSKSAAQGRVARTNGEYQGDLAHDAISAAARQIESNPGSQISLRSVAEALGVAHPSLYNHFANRSDLVAKVALSAFVDMLARITEAASNEPPLSAIYRAGNEVVNFAIDRPAVYRIMFGREVAERKSADPDLARAMEAPLRFVAALVEDGQSSGDLVEGDPLMVASAMWAAAHGASMLVIDRRLAVVGDDTATLVEQTLSAILRGFTLRPNAAIPSTGGTA